MVTTDQYYIYQLVPIIFSSFTMSHGPDSPFPRWIGYVLILAGRVFEVGPFGFLFKSGIFAWNGIGVFWFPLSFWHLAGRCVSFTTARPGAADGQPGRLAGGYVLG